MTLDSIEARIIGCLLEKESTTPEQYPLSLNALTLACNQKTSREPVMNLSDSEVLDGLGRLQQKRLVTEETGFGSRVSKYRHRFCNTEFADLQFSPPQLAIVCLLLLRGPQTAGELRTRAQRLYEFANIGEVETQLQALQAQTLLHQLPREAGKREVRFGELFSEAGTTPAPVPATVADEPLALRVQQLEQQVAELTRLVTQLQQAIE
ncbi:YceH family protein [Shewanella sp. YIC-542]|uniref:YceH family protein n=1 Tax=Shewanella mytili TaxID=3377111 RepID=UPI00398EE5B9